MASGPFVHTAIAAVGEVLIVLIIVEITRTVFTTPDSNGVAIRRLIVIVSALRGVLWISISPALASNNTSGMGTSVFHLVQLFESDSSAPAHGFCCRRAARNRAQLDEERRGRDSNPRWSLTPILA